MQIKALTSIILAGLSLGSTQAQNYEKVWIGFVSSSTVPDLHFAAFEVGNGNSLVVLPSEPQRHAIGNWQKISAQDLLVFTEESSKIPGKSIAERGEKAIHLLNRDEAKSLQHRQGDEFVMPIGLQLSRPSKWAAGVTTAAFSIRQDFTPVSIDRDLLMRNLREITGADKVRIAGKEVALNDRFSPAGRTNTQNFLKEYFASLGLESVTKCYKTGCNVEATLWGRSRERVVIFGSHFDAVTNTAADDNGSGIAAIMEVARILSSTPQEITFKFVGFDQEEKGLYGSKAYVDSLPASLVFPPLAAFSMDMIGYDKDNDGKFHLIDCGRVESIPLAQAVLDVATRINVGLQRSETCTERSDHASFWKRKIPALLASENFFGNDGNNCYHKKCDTIENMNFDYFAKITTLFANVGMAAGSAQ